jgi:hypothetical protein
MKRIILVALVGVLVSGTALAANDDAIHLHCSGLQINYIYSKEPPYLENHIAIFKNFKIALDGSWLSVGELKATRILEQKNLWMYRLKELGGTMVVSVNPKDLNLSYTWKSYLAKPEDTGSNISMACVPYKNPLTP